ncbi:hypothetical protein CC86DRAFT_422452 [Ophiobolus disseminans]|uniref:Glycosyltransferase family 2 protein n=1 Tax=Ophiobolus disseminans TaxID=1469910 RepID=A0A6A6ZSX9_9PLEO|nr:hypothetical protein CC86DRAFT_422452 [Ophiobolus disseminans]
MDASTTVATVLLCATFLWTVFLIYDVCSRPNPPSAIRSAGLLCHNIPAMFLVGTTMAAQSVETTALIWFAALIIFRYWRTLVNIYFWLQYKPAVASTNPKFRAEDCTVIVPTVGPRDNTVYKEMVAAILVNHPELLIFSTNTALATQEKQHNLGPMKVVPETLMLNADISNKRKQVVRAFSKVTTDILVIVDDTAIWHPRFLQAALPAFESKNVGFVGTRKWVKRLHHPRDLTVNIFAGLWKQCVAGCWNTIGAIYLVRHNFEIRATSAADGGVFCVSGRSSLIRSNIVHDHLFEGAFLNKYVLGLGPVMADDDNFITRWVINRGWDIKIQSSEEATMTTTLGTYPLKFPDQCKRWSRTTFRQNPIALFVDRTIWWKWPLTVWTTILPWLYNAALFWDSLAVYTPTQTGMYEQSHHRVAILCATVSFIWITKLVKTIPWFWKYPTDFFLYFMIPAYPLFAY